MALIPKGIGKDEERYQSFCRKRGHKLRVIFKEQNQYRINRVYQCRICNATLICFSLKKEEEDQGFT